MSSVGIEVVIASAAGEIVVVTTAIGWAGRRIVEAFLAVKKEVALLNTGRALTDAELPKLDRRLADVEDVIEEHGLKIAVLGNWREGHDRYHERNVLTVREAGATGGN